MNDAGDYLLFCGDHYYPAGGMFDLKKTGTINECKEFFESLIGGYRDNDWAHIVDRKTAKVFKKFKYTDYPSGEWVDPDPDDFEP
jgi:hypothetical protein